MIHADARTQLMTALSAQVKEVSIYHYKKPSQIRPGTASHPEFRKESQQISIKGGPRVE